MVRVDPEHDPDAANRIGIVYAGPFGSAFPAGDPGRNWVEKELSTKRTESHVFSVPLFGRQTEVTFLKFLN
jgi:hypothetical protein